MRYQGSALRLSELNGLIKSAISDYFPDALWVTAEIVEARCDRKGHCYLSLVEKEEDTVLAQIRANIWAYRYRELSSKFMKATGSPLKPGMQVLLLAEVNYHEVFGLSLNIRDIDPTYSLGDMARRKREIIERLRKEELFDRNRELPLPLVPQRIAVISSPSAAGYGDFMHHLENNPYGYSVFCTLYPAIVQGAEAVQSVVSAFSQIKEKTLLYDMVVLIRGGGSTVDLSSFDSYEIAAAIVSSSLPVLTGIGHERDDTVADMVAHTRVKTPTAAAEFVISGMRVFEERVEDAEKRLVRLTERALSEGKIRLEGAGRTLRLASSKVLIHHRSHIEKNDIRLQGSLGKYFLRRKNNLEALEKSLKVSAKQKVFAEGKRLDRIEQALTHLDPANVLKRGYSITYAGGKAIQSIHQVRPGDTIHTKIADGSISGTVSAVEESNV